MDKEIEYFVEQLEEAAKSNLISAILYGSFADQVEKKNKSDINIMIILKEISDAHIFNMRDVIRKNIKKLRLNPIIITKEEHLNSLDVFPVEYLEMKENFKVVYGDDLITGIDVTNENLQHQIEFELRSKLILMRKMWFNIENDAKVMKLFLVRNSASFCFLAKYADRILKEKHTLNLNIFEKINKVKKDEVKADKILLNKLYWELHYTVTELTKKIDEIK